MSRPIAYEGTEPYIFISYAHKDSDRVLPIVSALQERGFRMWYDAGIEAGSEWPEYIAEHLERCTVFLAFLSEAAVDSINCRQEIHFAIESRKELLIIYLEEITLSAGMRMRLGPLQAMYRNRHSSLASFLEELCRSRVLASCRCINTQQFPVPEFMIKEPMPKEPASLVREPDLEAIAALFEYAQTDNGGIEITDLKDKAITDVEIPWGVTSIGVSAFEGCSGLTSISIPNSVTSIGDSAFYGCSGLTSISIPNSVTRIDDYAFYGCSGLTSISIPNSVTSIGDYAFYWCSGLTSISVPNSVTSIGDAAFEGCSGLTSISIPASATEIGSGAFADCSHLTTIRVDERNPRYCSWNGILVSKDGKELHSFPGGKGGNNAIPYGVTSIGDAAFYGCSGLTSISIPDSVTSIHSSAFYRCSGLTSISIPDSVTKIGSHAFSFCTRLTSISIPASVTHIGERAFSCCSGLTSISIPDSVTKIGSHAFSFCTGLTICGKSGSEAERHAGKNGITFIAT